MSKDFLELGFILKSLLSAIPDTCNALCRITLIHEAYFGQKMAQPDRSVTLKCSFPCDLTSTFVNDI